MKKIIFIIYTTLFLAACGGSSSSTTSTPNNSDNSETVSKIGVFIDAPVKGLVYVSSPSGKDGVTNEKGEFEYIDGDTVSFNMGFIELGKAVPDKDKTVKVTQLREALLVAQLLQVLDADADENKIDVSDILIPKEIEETILKKLKGTAEISDEDEDENIITAEEFRAIKQKNPDKLTLQQRTEIVTKDRALEHIKQQIAESGLKFSTSSLENKWLIDSVFLTTYEGGIFGFSTAGHAINWVEVFDSKAEYSDVPWSVDGQGDLEVAVRKNDSCRLSKLAEGDLIHFDYACTNAITKTVSKGIRSFTKPKPFSANDLSGKSFNFTSLSGNKETLTFRNDGTLNCNGENSSCPYKDHPSYKNTVWIEEGSDNADEDTFMILAQGTLAKGKLLLIHYKDYGNTLDSVEVIKVSDNSLIQEFESVDHDHSSEGHNHNTDDNSDSKNNLNSGTQNNYPDIHSPNYIPSTTDANEYSSAMPEGFTAPPKDAAVTYALVDYYNPSTGETWQSSSGGYGLAPGWIIGTKEDYERNKEYYDNFLAEDGNVTYIPFTQEKLSGKRYYGLGAEDDEGITIFFGGDNKGQVWLSLTESTSSPDMAFDYIIDSAGYVIFSNVLEKGVRSNYKPAIALLGEIKNTLVVCWDNFSVNNIKDLCEDDAKMVLYKTKEAAEAEVRAHGEPDSQISQYIPFTTDMIKGKTIYSLTPPDDYDNEVTEVTIQFDNSTGKFQFGYHDNVTSPYGTFDYSIDSQGYLIFSNVVIDGRPIPVSPIHALMKKESVFLEVCVASSEESIACIGEVWFYNKKDAEAAVENQ